MLDVLVHRWLNLELAGLMAGHRVADVGTVRSRMWSLGDTPECEGSDCYAPTGEAGTILCTVLSRLLSMTAMILRRLSIITNPA